MEESGSNMVCPHPITVFIPNKNKTRVSPMEIGCGKCIMCRIQRVNEWTTRLYHESLIYKFDEMSFLTLTYNDQSVPIDEFGRPTLKKRDVQLFIKRLREKINYSNLVGAPRKKIKYFIAGEYGDEFGRPHYHAIIFNYYPDDLKFHKRTKKGFKLYTSGTLNEIWDKGHVIFGHVMRDSIQYVISYIFKIDNRKDEGKVWSLKSQGIGEDYVKKNRHKILKDMFVKVEGKKVGLPRYYKKKLDLNPYDIIGHKLEHDDKTKEIQRRIENGEETYFLRRQDIEMKAQTKIAKIEKSSSRRIVSSKQIDPRNLKNK